MNRPELIDLIKSLVDKGEITDVESFIYKTRASRTTASKILRSDEYQSVQIGKRTIYIKK